MNTTLALIASILKMGVFAKVAEGASTTRVSTDVTAIAPTNLDISDTCMLDTGKGCRHNSGIRWLISFRSVDSWSCKNSCPSGHDLLPWVCHGKKIPRLTLVGECWGHGTIGGRLQDCILESLSRGDEGACLDGEQVARTFSWLVVLSPPHMSSSTVTAASHRLADTLYRPMPIYQTRTIGGSAVR